MYNHMKYLITLLLLISLLSSCASTSNCEAYGSLEKESITSET